MTLCLIADRTDKPPLQQAAVYLSAAWAAGGIAWQEGFENGDLNGGAAATTLLERVQQALVASDA